MARCWWAARKYERENTATSGRAKINCTIGNVCERCTEDLRAAMCGTLYDLPTMGLSLHDIGLCLHLLAQQCSHDALLQDVRVDVGNEHIGHGLSLKLKVDLPGCLTHAGPTHSHVRAHPASEELFAVEKHSGFSSPHELQDVRWCKP
jgi:hypothetical protein